MTISAVRTRNKHGAGFTLLEIVMVLVIITIVIGSGIGMMYFSSEERTLRGASGEIEILAKRARTIAILHQTPYAIEFRPGRVRLLPLAEAGQDERTTALGNTIGGRRVETEDPEGRSPVREEISIDPDVTLSIRRWNTTAWQPMSDRFTHVWRFDPDGLCEPVSIRLATGESWAEDTYHPLTATISDSQLEAR